MLAKSKSDSKAPKNWVEKRMEIDERIVRLTRSPNKEATIEEVDTSKANENDMNDNETENDRPSVTKGLGRLDIGT